jgi:signal transduction histidine kinase
MKHLLLIISLLFFAGWQVQAQTDTEKELLKMEQDVASGTLSDFEMYKNYQTLLWKYHFSNPEKTRYYFQKLLAFAREKKNVVEESTCLRYMGAVCCDWGINDTALLFMNQAIKLVEGKDFFEEEYYNYNSRGRIYSSMDYFEKAIEDYHKALEATGKDKAVKIAAKKDISKNIHIEAFIMQQISVVYGLLYNNDKYLEYILKAKKIIDDNPDVDFSSLEHTLLSNLVVYYNRTDQREITLPLIERHYKLAKQKEDYSSMVSALINFADYYNFHLEDHKTALKYALEALQLAEQINNPAKIHQIENQLSKTYICLYDYKTALYYAERALAKIEELDNYELEMLYGNLVLIYGLMGENAKARHYQTKYSEILTKMADENTHKAIEELQVKYEVEQKEQAHQAELKRKQTLQYILIGGLTLTAFLIALLIYIVTLRNKRNRELADMNATKDKFFSIISHDLKNPAIAQRDALQLLLNSSAKWDKDALTNYYGKLLKSADGQVILLYNMLNWAYLQTGKMPFVANPFNLKAALKSDIDLIQNMAEQKGVTFNINFPEQTTVTGDENMLLIVIRNLLTNAVKFTETGGTVTLDITPIQSLTPSSLISISDTGTGMTPEQLQNLFLLDKKRSTTGTAGEQGSGLGLIVCKELVEKHGSALNVDSERGMGSRFWFEI